MLHHELAPLSHAVPELRAHQDQRERPDLPALDERGRLEQFVERAQPAGHDDESARVFHQADLAREEIAELDALVHVGIRRLLVRQDDVQPVARAAGLMRAAIGRLHDARARRR